MVATVTSVRRGRAARATAVVLLVGLMAAPDAAGAAPPAAVDGADADRVAGALHAGLVPRAVDLGVPGVRSEATVVSDTGVVAGWYADEDGEQHAFRWRDGRLELLTGLRSSVPSDVNDAGQVAVHGVFPWAPWGAALLWGTNGGVSSVFSGDAPSRARGLNDHGVVTFTFDTREDTGHGGVRRPGEIDQVLAPEGAVTGGVAGRHSVNDRGEVVGWSRWEVDGPAVGWRWRDGVFTYLAGPVGAATSTLAINERGQVLARIDGTGVVLWEPGGRVRALDPAGTQFSAGVLNERGVAAGSAAPGGSTVRRAATADVHGVRLLRGVGAHPSEARAITDHGLVVGWAARDAAGAPHATAWVQGRPVALGEVVAGAAGVGSTAHDVNERGLVAGTVTTTGVDGLPASRAVVWELVPRR